MPASYFKRNQSKIVCNGNLYFDQIVLVITAFYKAVQRFHSPGK